MVAVLIEYIRSLNQFQIPVQVSTDQGHMVKCILVGNLFTLMCLLSDYVCSEKNIQLNIKLVEFCITF